jgi:ribokinase
MATVVVVGSSNVDLTAYCTRFPDDGETLAGTSFHQGFGGKGANQAVMAARLGVPVAFLSRVGDDTLGADVLANLAGHGVDTTHVVVTPGTSTGVAPIWVDERGVNRILVVPGANGRLSPDDIAAAAGVLSSAAVVTAQLETPLAATLAAFRVARESGAVTILNPAPAAPLPAEVLALVDWLVPNEPEFAALFGAAPGADAVTAVERGTGCRLAVTLGAAGVLVGRRIVAAPSVPVVDTTGAGDAFVAGFAAGLAGGRDVLDAARLGCVCGALSVTRPGAQASFPDRAEVDGVLAGYVSS